MVIKILSLFLVVLPVSLAKRECFPQYCLDNYEKVSLRSGPVVNTTTVQSLGGRGIQFFMEVDTGDQVDAFILDDSNYQSFVNAQSDFTCTIATSGCHQHLAKLRLTKAETRTFDLTTTGLIYIVFRGTPATLINYRYVFGNREELADSCFVTALTPIRVIFGSTGTFLSLLLLYVVVRNFARHHKQHRERVVEDSVDSVADDEDHVVDENSNLIGSKGEQEFPEGTCFGILEIPQTSFRVYYLRRCKFTWPFFPLPNEKLERSERMFAFFFISSIGLLIQTTLAVWIQKQQLAYQTQETVFSSIVARIGFSNILSIIASLFIIHGMRALKTADKCLQATLYVLIGMFFLYTLAGLIRLVDLAPCVVVVEQFLLPFVLSELTHAMLEIPVHAAMFFCLVKQKKIKQKREKRSSEPSLEL